MKTFLHASTEGFKVDPNEVDDTPGIGITEDVLKALGCEKVGKQWQFRMHGYEFVFKPDQGGHWTFITPGYKHGHSVTHLDECFGFIAEDLYEAGRVQKLVEIRDALGIGGEIGNNAKIKTPESDPS